MPIDIGAHGGAYGGGKYRKGSELKIGEYENYNLNIADYTITDKEMKYLYKWTTSSLSRLNIITGEVIWTVAIPTTYNPICVTSDGVVYGSSNENSTASRRTNKVDSNGIITYKTWFSGPQNNYPSISMIGKYMSDSYVSGTNFYAWASNFTIDNGLVYYNDGVLVWSIYYDNFSYSDSICIQKSTGKLIGFKNNGDGTHTVKRYNATTGASAGSSNTLSIGASNSHAYYFGGEDFYIKLGDAYHRYNVNDGVKINSGTLAGTIIGEKDANTLYVQDTKFYEVDKSALIRTEIYDGRHVKNTVNFFKRDESKDMFYISNYGKIGLNFQGVKIL